MIDPETIYAIAIDRQQKEIEQSTFALAPKAPSVSEYIFTCSMTGEDSVHYACSQHAEYMPNCNPEEGVDVRPAPGCECDFCPDAP